MEDRRIVTYSREGFQKHFAPKYYFTDERWHTLRLGVPWTRKLAPIGWKDYFSINSYSAFGPRIFVGFFDKKRLDGAATQGVLILQGED